TPALTATAEIDRSHAEQIVNRARKAQHTLLTEIESKQLLAAYGIPTVETKIAMTEEEAVEIAKEIGGRVLRKIYPQFGAVLLLCTGGYFVEVFKDRALGLPPLNRTLARRLM